MARAALARAQVDYCYALELASARVGFSSVSSSTMSRAKRRAVAKNLLDISASVKEAAAGLLNEEASPSEDSRCIMIKWLL